jgi:hypothetical protein
LVYRGPGSARKRRTFPVRAYAAIPEP